MIAAVLKQPRKIALEKTSLPEINEEQVRVQVQGCGICASSIPVWEGREWFTYPVEPGTPGHEGWGIVDKVGDRVSGVKAGDRVAFLSNRAYAEYDIAGENSFVRLPESLSGKPFPGEPLGCAMNIFERSDIGKDDVVAVIGIGFLGALICQLAKYSGAKVIAISRREYSLEIAKRYGADECIRLTDKRETVNKVMEATGKDMCTRVMEATGKQEAIDIATELIAEGGRMVIAGFHQDGMRSVDMQKWNWKGIDVINAHERRPERYLHGMRNAVEAVEKGIISPDGLYTDVLPINKIAQGFELTCQRPHGFVKALVAL